MADTPNYKFHRSPRFSANQLADYLSTQTPQQREAVIRSAKFPRKTAVVPYTKGRRTICGFLSSNAGDLAAMDDDIERLETQLRREPEGWQRTELRRNLNAIEQFKETFTKTRAGRHRFTPGPTDLTMMLEGVRINVRLDVSVIEETPERPTYFGGCVLFLASTEAARKNIEDRSKTVAALVHWGMQASNENVEILDRLCLSFDVFGRALTRAPKSVDRLRNNMAIACREAASSWAGVRPPAGYDGPDWA